MTDPAPAPAPEAAPAPAPTPTPSPTPTPAPTPSDPWQAYKPIEGVDPKIAGSVVEFVKKHGGNPDIANAILKRDMEAATREEQEFKELSEKGWLEELQKDPVLGGEKVRETMVDAMRAFDRLTPDLQIAIKEQGVLYNPIVIRLLHQFGVGFRAAPFTRPGATPAPSPARSIDDRLMDIFTPKK